MNLAMRSNATPQPEDPEIAQLFASSAADLLLQFPSPDFPAPPAFT